ncbi:MAG: SDR family oxidoreductase [Elusimicrobia bacterium]|nr:SDR family oxidoreductase [Elusimicrobiota bacterium]
MSKDIAVVTGASGGIGRAIAKAIHEKSEGEMRLCLHYNGNEAKAKEVSAEIPESFVVKADLSSAAGRKTLLDAALKEGTPYVLVNNAGVDKPHEPALMITEGAFDALINTNLRSSVFLMKDFGNEMTRAGSGCIVNVSSVLARKALVGSALYRASKAALEEVTRQFAFELGPRGVRVNSVAPGFIETAMTAGIDDAMKEKIRAQIALGEFGVPEAVASAVCQLIENDYINGANIAVDGGMIL